MVSLHAAVDLGASSGRVVLARVQADAVELEVVHRWPNVPVRLPDGLHWDILRLHAETLEGLAAAARAAGETGVPLATIGIDSWAVDYGLLDADGGLLGNPFHYRDARNDAAVEVVHSRMSHADLYAVNGLQFLPFNTVYQLAAEQDTARMGVADRLLLIPDLLGYFLTGELCAERTNASTTGLLDVRSGAWSSQVTAAAGVDPELLPELRDSGELLGPLRPDVATDAGVSASTVVITVGSHDTASAVVGVPAAGERWAFISCGTWSLVGVELDAPVLTDASRVANFTNEGGVDGTIRYLRNVMGLWVLSESLRTWQRAGLTFDMETLLPAAADVGAGGPVVDVDDASLLAPGAMPGRIAALCRATDQPVPASQAAMVRCILDSLAAAYARTLREGVSLTGRDVDVVHLVGGGAQNTLLCQLAADACQRPVLAGPVEATALGNVVIQARADGSLVGDLATLRALIAATQPVRSYQPRAVVPSLSRS